MKLFIANKNYSSWSLRPWVLLTTLNVSFEEVLVPFEGGGPQPKFRAFSPTGKVPCLDVDGITVWDSMAIMETIAELHPGAHPESFEARAWARSASAEMHAGFSAIRNECTMTCGQRIELTDPSATLTSEWKRLCELWEEGLARFGGPFLAGDTFTMVDAFYAPVAFRVQSYSPDLSPEAMAYVHRLLELESMRDWYAQALQETWRDDDHERDVLAVGTVLEDLRS